MTRKQSTKKGGTKGKAEGSDELTPERVRIILESPDVKESVKDSLTYYVGQFYVATDADTLPEGPEEVALELEQALYIFGEKGGQTPAARDAYAKLVAAVERHEPKDARLVRRLSAMLRDPKTPDEVINQVGQIMCELSGETQVDDLHPDVFETLARVYVREARRGAAVKVGRSKKARQAWLRENDGPARRACSGRPWMFKKYLEELEAIAAGE